MCSRKVAHTSAFIANEHHRNEEGEGGSYNWIVAFSVVIINMPAMMNKVCPDAVRSLELFDVELIFGKHTKYVMALNFS